tara:strand:- start:5567 stop:5893 length:327 start_codon:yes stop_codon:yes gene_type:complete
MNTLSFLLSDKAAGQRMSGRKPAFVVHVETDSDMSVADRFVELDADDIVHADTIAMRWIMRGNTSAAMRRCLHDGTLTDTIGPIMDQTFVIRPLNADAGWDQSFDTHN